MRNTVLAVATVVMTLLLACAAAEERDGSQENALRPEERALARVLGNRATTLEEGLRALGEHEVDRDRDAGFGGRRVRVRLHRGRLTAWVTLAGFRGELAALDVQIRAPEELWSQVSEEFVTASAGAFTASASGALGQRSVDRVLDAHRAAVRAGLGDGPDVARAALPEELGDALDTLTSPTRWYPVGTSFGYAGVEPDGLVAARRIREAGEPKLLRAALRGLNPEGRVVAALALLEHAEDGGDLEAADRRAIEAIRTSPVPIEHCRGCEVHVGRAGEAFAAD